jgi:hypothetical protein
VRAEAMKWRSLTEVVDCPSIRPLGVDPYSTSGSLPISV